MWWLYNKLLGGGFKYLFTFSGLFGEEEPILRSIFFTGWFNHHLDEIFVVGTDNTNIYLREFSGIEIKHDDFFCLNGIFFGFELWRESWVMSTFKGCTFEESIWKFWRITRLMESADSGGWSNFDSCNLFKTAGFPKLKVPHRNLTYTAYQTLPSLKGVTFPKPPFLSIHVSFRPPPKRNNVFFQQKEKPPGIDRNVLKWGTTSRNRMPGFNDNSLVWQTYPRWFILFFYTKIEVLYLKTVGERGGWRWRALTGKAQFLLFRMLPCCFWFMLAMVIYR